MDASPLLYIHTQAGPSGRADYGVVLAIWIAGSNPARGMDVCLCFYTFRCAVSVQAFVTRQSLV
jgi:hypothetical protein